MTITIRKVTNKDWNQVKFIYEAGMETKTATFETEAPSSYEKWIENAQQECSFVAEEGPTIVGWCKLSPVSVRKVYSGVGEVSIYIHPSAKRKGIGNLLLQTLVNKSEEQGYWTLEAKVFKENEASIHLHQKNGFKIVGFREKIGKRDGMWHDNVFLERRSTLVGIE